MATTTLHETSLAVRAIGDRTDFAGVDVTDISAEEDRFPAIVFTGGVLRPSNAFLPAEGAGGTMNVVLGSGAAKADYAVVEGLASGQGNYVVRLEAATASVTLDAASVQARIDEVYLVVQDNTYDSSSRGVVSLAVRKGDAAASPVAPGPDANWDAYLLVASVAVPNSALDILDCTITDERPSARIASPYGGLAPVGSGSLFFGDTAPEGYLLAQGQAVSRTTYSDLFGVVGTAYGVGDGSTTFNLPDLRQKFPLGKADSGTGDNLGETGGAINHTHTNPTTSSNGAHTHDAASNVNAGATLIYETTASNPDTARTTSNGAHTHTQGATGSGNPPYLVVNYIVKF
jgi:microcystin-dependent protein